MDQLKHPSVSRGHIWPLLTMNGLLNVAFYLAGAPQIRAKPTAGLDADVLERASTYLEQAASELEAMRSEC